MADRKSLNRIKVVLAEKEHTSKLAGREAWQETSDSVEMVYQRHAATDRDFD